jgi:myo-inositol-hexaphosphate 3-phosphohydrolase
MFTMTRPTRLAALLLCSLLFTSCATSLEQIVEQRHQKRIDDTIANQPVTHGAADGMGSYIADTAPRLSVQSPQSPRPSNP